jgi:hypothetical protein
LSRKDDVVVQTEEVYLLMTAQRIEMWKKKPGRTIACFIQVGRHPKAITSFALLVPRTKGVRTLLPAGSKDGSSRKYPDLPVVGHWQVQGLGKTNEVSLDAQSYTTTRL